jgi:hypothetical protein
MTKFPKSPLFLLLLLTNTACASTLSEERRDYIKAHPHGWFELSINDTNIPDIPIVEDGVLSNKKPTTCYVSILSNSELMLRQRIYPHGTQAPYSVLSGFRYPIPTGAQHIEIKYQGCAIDETGKLQTRSYEVEIFATEELVYSVTLKQVGLTEVSVSANETVTLEKVYKVLIED